MGAIGNSGWAYTLLGVRSPIRFLAFPCFLTQQAIPNLPAQDLKSVCLQEVLFPLIKYFINVDLSGRVLTASNVQCVQLLVVSGARG